MQQRRARQAAFQQRRAEAKKRQESLSKEYDDLLKEDNRTVYENYDNQAHVLKRKKKRRLGLFYGILAVLFISLGCLVIGLLFFKVQTIQVVGNLRYDKDAILQTASIQSGTNLFSVNEKEVEERLIRQYPYIASVKLERKWPDTLVVRITETEAFYAVKEQEKDSYALLSEDLKVLETGTYTFGDAVCEIQGVECVAPVCGQAVQFSNEEAFENFSSLIQELQRQECEKITYMNFTNLVDISITYEDRIQIRLGSIVQLEYKLQYAKYLIENEIDPKQKGILNLIQVEDGKASFQPKNQIVDGENAQTDEFYFPPEAEKPYVPSSDSQQQSESQQEEGGV